MVVEDASEVTTPCRFPTLTRPYPSLDEMQIETLADGQLRDHLGPSLPLVGNLVRVVCLSEKAVSAWA